MDTTTYTVLAQGDGTDALGTPYAFVAVTSGDLFAEHYSYRRGGCLYAGFVALRNNRTGQEREVDITSWARNTEAHVQYLLGLAEKHVS